MQCSLPVAKAAMAAGSLTAAVVIGAIIAQAASSSGAPRKGSASGTETAVLLVLRVLAVVGILTVWSVLGYCVLKIYIDDRRAPATQPLSCDAHLLDPLFYVTAVVLTCLAVAGAAVIVDASIACCCPPSSQGKAGGQSKGASPARSPRHTPASPRIPPSCLALAGGSGLTGLLGFGATEGGAGRTGGARRVQQQRGGGAGDVEAGGDDESRPLRR